MSAKLIEVPAATLQAKVPAMFTKVNRLMSQDYKHIVTSELVAIMRESGYVPTFADQDRPTRRDPALVRHQIRMTHESLLGAKVNDTIPQVIITNSHNGRTKLSLAAGFFRLVCENGMMAGSAYNNNRLTHLADIREQIAAVIADVQLQTERGVNVIGDWQSINLTARRQGALAKAGLVLRFGKEAAKGYDTKQVLVARRNEDEGDDLWRVFNRVQESVVRGGMGGVSANGRKTTARALAGITSQNEINRGLWDAAEKMAA